MVFSKLQESAVKVVIGLRMKFRFNPISFKLDIQIIYYMINNKNVLRRHYYGFLRVFKDNLVRLFGLKTFIK